jgi:uncharacterized protein
VSARAGSERSVPGTSALALTRVGHRRFRPRPHALRHHTLHVLVDVDALTTLERDVTGFGFDRRAPVAIHATDHLEGRSGPLRERLRELVERAGATLPTGRLQLLAHPRMLGHVFNPVAWWFAHDEEGTLSLVVAEVTSTFGDRALYVLDELVRGEDGMCHASATKRLHVSPFLPVEGLEYRFSFLPPDLSRDDRALVHMEVIDAEGTVLSATQDARFLPFDTANLRRVALRHPLASLSAIVAIHGNALRLWRLGVPFHRRPTAPTDALRIGGRPVTALPEQPTPPSRRSR